MGFFKRAPSRTREPEGSANGKRHRVLFVDDEEGNLFVAKEMLAEQPHEILTAPDGASALEILESTSVAVLVSDQRMPGMTGVELLQRAAEQWPDTVRLLLTGFADMGAVVDAINRAAIWRYLTKPIDATDLQHAIRLAVEQYRVRREHDQELGRLRARIDELELEVGERDDLISRLKRDQQAG